MTIKVQIIGKSTVKSMVESGIENSNKPLTFLAYSDQMKARMFESFLKKENKGRIAISIYDRENRDGEWHEELVKDSIIN